MRRTRKILSFLIALIFILIAPAFAQTKIQVVTRTISRTFAYHPGCIFEIKSEKANIQVKKSSDNNLRIKLLLVSKNPSKEQAEKDLKYSDYKITESKDAIGVSNFFNNQNQFKEISSNLSAKYEIEVPSGTILKLKNIYGTVDIIGATGTFNISLDFCQISLSNVSGNISINSNYSDIKGENISAITNIQAQKGDIVFTNIKNLLKIRDQYGTISLENINSNVSVDAEMTAINAAIDNPEFYALDFTVKEGEIVTPEKLRKNVVSKQGEEKLITTGGKISIKILTTYNSITLKTK
jgi:hypothetical protein